MATPDSLSHSPGLLPVLPASKPTRLQPPLCPQLPQSAKPSTAHPGLTRLVTPTLEMPNTSRTASSIALSIHTDSEESPQVPQEKKSRRFVAPWLTGRSRRYPFLLATILYLALVGIIAGVVSWSYDRDLHRSSPTIKYTGEGVSFSLV